MPLSKSKKFLYSRIALLASLAASGLFAALGFLGYHLWRGGLAFSLWTALGVMNLTQKSSLRLLFKRPWAFCALYAALTAYGFLVDQFGRNQNLWFYLSYRSAALVWNTFFLYPFGALAVLELFYFLAGFLGEPISFARKPLTGVRKTLDRLEPVAFLAVIGLTAAGAARFPVSIPVAAAVLFLWLGLFLAWLRLHAVSPGQCALIILLPPALAFCLRELPNLSPWEWVSPDSPLKAAFLRLPLFVWLGSYLALLLPVRLWVFLLQLKATGMTWGSSRRRAA